MLDEHAEHELYHLTVKGIVHKGQADIQIDLAILMDIILKALIAGIQVVEIFLDPGLLVFRQPTDYLRADNGENTGINQYGHRQNLTARFNAGTEQHRSIIIIHRLCAEHIDVVLNQEFLKLNRLFIILYSFFGTFSWHNYSFIKMQNNGRHCCN